MKNSALFTFLSFCHILFSQNTVNYTSSSDIFANPERGFHKYSITDANYTTTANYSNISTSELNSWYSGVDKVSVVFRYFLLEDFLNSNINATYLSNMQIDFNRIRAAGLKCIIRFSYSNQVTAAVQQASKTQIIVHLNQLASIINLNKDIIVSHQAGLIGTWGEWYYTNSTEFGTEGNLNATQWQNRKEVVDAMLAITPVSIPIQVRYPLLKKNMYGNLPLNAITAYQSTALGRIGFFNDAFLNDYGDQGTYEVNSQFDNPVGTPDYVYLSNETNYLPMTGETNGLNAPRTNGANAVLELDDTNWSMINRDYFEQNIVNWTTSNHIDDIKRKLGYRFVLNNSTFNLTGSNLSVQISLANEGYARMFMQRNVYLVLRNNSTLQNTSFLIDNTDCRTWGNTIFLNKIFNISSLPFGNYSSYLFLPDIENALASNPKYAVRFANNTVWEPISGMNNLSQNVNFTALNATSFDNFEVLIYPNPSNESVTIQAKNCVVKSIELVNNLGQRISVVNNLNTIDVSKLASGNYLLYIETDLGKLVKQIVKK